MGARPRKGQAAARAAGPAEAHAIDHAIGVSADEPRGCRASGQEGVASGGTAAKGAPVELLDAAALAGRHMGGALREVTCGIRHALGHGSLSTR